MSGLYVDMQTAISSPPASVVATPGWDGAASGATISIAAIAVVDSPPSSRRA